MLFHCIIISYELGDLCIHIHQGHFIGDGVILCDCICAREVHLGLSSLNGKMAYTQIPWILVGARLDVVMIVSLWNLTDISAAVEVPVKFQSD